MELIGAKVRILIGEPWDAEGFLATISNIVRIDDRDYMIIKKR